MNGARRGVARGPGRLAGATVVAVGLVVVTSLGGCALSLQALPKIQGANGPTYPLHAVFANVLNLPVNAQVRMGAEVIGQVGAISTSDFKADLTLDIKRSVRLPVGSTAQIRFDNPLGDEYVLVFAPTPGSLAGQGAIPPGGTIPERDTSTAPSVEDTFAALSLVLNGGGLNQLQVIIHELNDTFNGNQPQIRSFLTTIDRAVNSLSGGRAAVDGALASIERLSTSLNSGRNTIGSGLDSIAPAIGVLASENDQIASLLSELSDLGTVGTRVAVQSGENSVADVHDLLPVVQQLDGVTAQLAPDLADLGAFETASRKLAPGAYLQVSAVADVLLPAGAFEPTVLSGAEAPPGATAATGAPTSGAAAVSTLLGNGLL